MQLSRGLDDLHYVLMTFVGLRTLIDHVSSVVIYLRLLMVCTKTSMMIEYLRVELILYDNYEMEYVDAS
jgi:hypothetical protein